MAFPACRAPPRDGPWSNEFPKVQVRRRILLSHNTPGVAQAAERVVDPRGAYAAGPIVAADGGAVLARALVLVDTGMHRAHVQDPEPTWRGQPFAELLTPVMRPADSDRVRSPRPQPQQDRHADGRPDQRELGHGARPEEVAAYFDLAYQATGDAVLVGSSGWPMPGWTPLPAGHVLVTDRRTLATTVAPIGTRELNPGDSATHPIV